MVRTGNLLKRQKRIRRKIRAVSSLPRLSVFRSNQHIAAQIINDQKGVTLASASDLNDQSGTKTERAARVGAALAKLAKTIKVSNVVFDRGGYRFHGRVRALAEAARQGGLKF